MDAKEALSKCDVTVQSSATFWHILPLSCRKSPQKSMRLGCTCNETSQNPNMNLLYNYLLRKERFVAVLLQFCSIFCNISKWQLVEFNLPCQNNKGISAVNDHCIYALVAQISQISGQTILSRLLFTNSPYH
jgi:hypothetical protein